VPLGWFAALVNLPRHARPSRASCQSCLRDRHAPYDHSERNDHSGNPMAHPRSYNDAQREAIWRLHEAGLKSPEIAAACADGRTGLARFTIPARTVRDILAKMASAADQKLPSTLAELETVQAIKRAPVRAARIVEAELDRIEVKQAKRGLSDQEVDRLPRLAAHGARIAKLLEGQGGPRTQRGIASDRAKPRPKEEGPIERLAREQQEQGSVNVQPSSTRTHRQGADSDAEPAEDVTAATDALEQKSPAERAEIAQKAQAALAG
jgi:hypothetical protein